MKERVKGIINTIINFRKILVLVISTLQLSQKKIVKYSDNPSGSCQVKHVLISNNKISYG